MHGQQNIKITRNVPKIATSNNKLRNVCMSVRPPTRKQLGSHYKDFHEILNSIISENLWRKFKIH